MRYCFQKDSKPLLPNISPKPPAQIPACENCGSERYFEFQVPYIMLNRSVHASNLISKKFLFKVFIFYFLFKISAAKYNFGVFKVDKGAL